jgi:CheY-like chemotaxis protein
MENIILIDDDLITSSLNKLLIEDVIPNAEIIKIGNGQEALDYLYQTVKFRQKLPDLIFVDINMPIMDGFEFLEALENRRINIPCVMLTSSMNVNDIEKASKFNLVSYIEKPLSTFKIKSVMQKLEAYSS